MSPLLITLVLLLYFILLLGISHFTSQKISTNSFFKGNSNNKWYWVAFGMIGSSLSGVTFISVPGWVLSSNFSYLQMVLGYFAGYLVISRVLLPLYYKLSLTSIYTYLNMRFGTITHKTGAGFFLLSRSIGTALRLYLVALIFHNFVFKAWQIPFEVTVFITLSLIWLYTYRGGIRTIIFTDMLQTACMLIAVTASLWLIINQLNWSPTQAIINVNNNEMSRIFDWDLQSKTYFWKQFFAGMFITIVMTGLDQDMMQKNLSCKNLKDAQKNMFWFSLVLIFVNILFLFLGVMLYTYAETNNIAWPLKNETDTFYPNLAFNHFPLSLGLIFVIGLVAAAYSTADSALTALTTSICFDFNSANGANISVKSRKWIHALVTVGIGLLIIIFYYINNKAVIEKVFQIAGYTYGPLLGLFSFGLFTKLKPKDKLVPFLAVLSPILCYYLNENAEHWLNGYKFGFELLILNGAIMFLGLVVTSIKKKDNGRKLKH